MSATPKSYVTITTIEPLRIVRPVDGDTLYVSWFDRDARQTRRASLHTTSIAVACERVTSIIDRGASEDPRRALKGQFIATVADLLDWHEPYTRGLASAEAEGIHVRLLKGSLIGPRRLNSLTDEDFQALRKSWESTATGTISRRLSTLRSAVNRARRAKLLPPNAVLHVPEFSTRQHKRSVRPKGQPCDTRQLAALFDAAAEPHVAVYLAVLFSTAVRASSVLDLQRSQVDFGMNQIDFNPSGREQTKKHRPTLPIIPALSNWLEPCPAGYVVHYHGERIVSIKTAIRGCVARADLPPRINSYSVRHSAARYMTKRRVDPEQRAIWLGHIQPPATPETTFIYSPFEPDYLKEAAEVMQEFVCEIASHAKRSLVSPPLDVLAYYAEQRTPADA
jgi:integrase